MTAISNERQIRCLLLDDDALDFEYTKHCLAQILGTDRVVIDHVATIEAADGALALTNYDIAILDYYVGPRTPMSLLRHFDNTHADCAVLVLSSVHPSIVAPFLDAIGNGVFLEKTSFSLRALSAALKKAGLDFGQADAAIGSKPCPPVLSVSENMA